MTPDERLAATMAAAKARTIEHHQRTTGAATAARLIATLDRR